MRRSCEYQYSSVITTSLLMPLLSAGMIWVSRTPCALDLVDAQIFFFDELVLWKVGAGGRSEKSGRHSCRRTVHCAGQEGAARDIKAGGNPGLRVVEEDAKEFGCGSVSNRHEHAPLVVDAAPAVAADLADCLEVGDAAVWCHNYALYTDDRAERRVRNGRYEDVRTALCQSARNSKEDQATDGKSKRSTNASPSSGNMIRRHHTGGDLFRESNLEAV
jgi:hypothetical protein